MNRDRRSSSHDPTDEPMVDQSAQTASGLSAGNTSRRQPGSTERPDDEIVGGIGPLETPRRYEQPIEEDDDPVMPSEDSTLHTKI
jgi:hypothetical protein